MYTIKLLVLSILVFFICFLSSTKIEYIIVICVESVLCISTSYRFAYYYKQPTHLAMRARFGPYNGSSIFFLSLFIFVSVFLVAFSLFSFNCRAICCCAVTRCMRLNKAVHLTSNVKFVANPNYRPTED